MQLRHKELWTRLNAMEIGPAEATLTFQGRLARENGWSLRYAQRAILEYKRFVFLAWTSDQIVTPSDEVDQVWHLHLTYTRSYWDDMCGDILGGPLHHGPTRGGESQGRFFFERYSSTLTQYQSVFGHPPPSDVWPDPHRRFEGADRFCRVNLAHHIVLPFRRSSWRRSAMLLSLTFLGIGCVAVGTADSKYKSIVETSVVFVLITILVCVIYKYRGRGGSGCSGGAGCGAHLGGASGGGTNDDSGGGCGSGCGSGCGGGGN